MSKSLYLINPLNDVSHYFDVRIFEKVGLSNHVYSVDLPITTLAAMIPADFNYELCEEAFEKVDFDKKPDYVLITGKISQKNRMFEIADTFRQKGIRVIIGGSFASLVSHEVKEHCDTIVIGELENIYHDFFNDIRNNNLKPEYNGTYSNLEEPIIPDLSKYPNSKTFYGALQISKGCPFRCEFCDVVVYVGGKQRYKPVANIIAELDNMYKHGYRVIFVVDDNLTGNKKKSREILEAIRGWNNNLQHGRVYFFTQLSMECAKDRNLLQLLSEAGFESVFLGIETNNPESLKEANKNQNLKIDLKEEVLRFLEYGITITGGLMAGFDADTPVSIKKLLDFTMEMPIPVFTLGMVNAPYSTPLYKRLKGENRIDESGSGFAGLPWETNIIHPSMSKDELYQSVKWLVSNLYHPKNFEKRLRLFCTHYNTQAPSFSIKSSNTSMDPASAEIQMALYDSRVKLLDIISGLGELEKEMVEGIKKDFSNSRELWPLLLIYLTSYAQIRDNLDREGVYDTSLVV